MFSPYRQENMMRDRVVFYLRTFVAYCVIAVGAMLIYLSRNDREKMDRCRIKISRSILKSAALSYAVKGELDRDTDLIIANHQSMMDIFLLESYVGPEIRFVGRKGIMDTWPVGLVTDIIGHITIDRSDRRSGVKLLKAVREKNGKKVVIFPEGTRSFDGEIKPFEPGAKMVAEKLGLKVQPVVIKGLRELYSEGNKHSRKGTVQIEVLPPVDVKVGWFEQSREAMIAVQKAS